MFSFFGLDPIHWLIIGFMGIGGVVAVVISQNRKKACPYCLNRFKRRPSSASTAASTSTSLRMPTSELNPITSSTA